MPKEIKWSDEQLEAINAKGQNTLVSAGAGSGKTTVLTERIFRLVFDGTPITRFLVLTFTKAATNEMKTRIRKRFIESEGFKQVAFDVENAHIETIDSFLLFIVKKYSLDLGISPNTSVIDPTLLAIAKNKAFDEVLLNEIEINDGSLRKLVSTYCFKDYNFIRDLVDKILIYADKRIDKENFLNHFNDGFYTEEFIDQIIENHRLFILNGVKKLRTSLDEYLTDPDDYQRVDEYFEELLSCNTYDTLMTYYADVKYPSKKARSETSKEDYDLIRNAFKNLFGESQNFSDDIKSVYLEQKDLVLKAFDLAKKVDAKLSEYKNKISCYSFDDLSHLALKALSISQNGEEIKGMFDYIMIDEYQDTSDVQEAIMNIIGNNNVYMVGDVKQSIYAFRNANCKLFQEKSLLYEANNGGKLIRLNASYRAREEIVESVNNIFGQLFDKQTNPIDYKNGHVFEFGLKDISNHKYKNQNYGVKSIKFTVPDGENAIEVQANIIANDIIKRLNDGFEVYDRSIKQLRKAEPKDFAILIRKTTHFGTYSKVFGEKGLAINVVDSVDYMNEDIAAVIRNLITMYFYVSNEDYGNGFIHSFVSIARSFIYRLEDQEIYDIVKARNYEDTELLKSFHYIVEKCKGRAIKYVFSQLLSYFNVYERINTMSNFEDNIQRIESLLVLASQMDDLGFSIKDFVDYFKDLNKIDETSEIDNADLNRKAVALMTIHKSKGLEYAVCYCPEFNNSFSMRGNSDGCKVRFSEKYGTILPSPRFEDKSLLNSLYKNDVERAAFEEELRILYVAITRSAEEAIILNDVTKDSKKLFDVTKANSYKQVLDYYGILEQIDFPYEFEEENLKFDETHYEAKEITIKSIDVPSKAIEFKRASKENADGSDIQDLLEFGTRLHYLLEITDFSQKNIEFIKDYQMKKYVSNVLNCGLFDNMTECKLLHEYRFIDDVNGVNGIIDALLIKSKEIDIIDFKLKNLDDDKYVIQLKTYRDFIKQIVKDKEIKMYLISSITGEVKEIV